MKTQAYSGPQLNMSSPILDLEQMRQHYHDEWLLIAYTDIDENLNVLCGEVLAHDKDANKLGVAYLWYEH